jgi:hypothetical protein
MKQFAQNEGRKRGRKEERKEGRERERVTIESDECL